MESSVVESVLNNSTEAVFADNDTPIDSMKLKDDLCDSCCIAANGVSMKSNHTGNIRELSPMGEIREMFDNEELPLIWKLPGWGEGSPHCGMGYKVAACPEHREKARAVVQHCEKRSCPKCKGHWVSELSNKAADRLYTGALLYKKGGWNLGKLKHIVLSPPQAWAIRLSATVEGRKELQKRCNVVLKRMCGMGGCKVYHQWRLTDKAKREFAILKQSEDIVLTGGIWKWIMDNGLGENYEYVYIAPHFHCLVYGYLQPSDIFHDESGWIYKNITAINEREGKGNYLNVGATLSYQLSHCAIGYTDLEGKSRFQALTWYGMFSYNKLKKDKEKSYDDVVTESCEECERDKHLYEGSFGVDILIEDGEIVKIKWDEMYDCGVYERKIKVIVYKIVRGSVIYRWNTEKECKEKAVFKIKKQSKLKG